MGELIVDGTCSMSHAENSESMRNWKENW